jgi:hypothetical protein
MGAILLSFNWSGKRQAGQFDSPAGRHDRAVGQQDRGRRVVSSQAWIGSSARRAGGEPRVGRRIVDFPVR